VFAPESFTAAAIEPLASAEKERLGPTLDDDAAQAAIAPADCQPLSNVGRGRRPATRQEVEQLYVAWMEKNKDQPFHPDEDADLAHMKQAAGISRNRVRELRRTLLPPYRRRPQRRPTKEESGRGTAQ
jgi:hypothetical protein